MPQIETLSIKIPIWNFLAEISALKSSKAAKRFARWIKSCSSARSNKKLIENTNFELFAEQVRLMWPVRSWSNLSIKFVE